MNLIYQLISVQYQKQSLSNIKSKHNLHTCFMYGKSLFLEPLVEKEWLIERALPSEETPTVCLKASVD